MTITLRDLDALARVQNLVLRYVPENPGCGVLKVDAGQRADAVQADRRLLGDPDARWRRCVRRWASKH